jgi:hypothetical protein
VGTGRQRANGDGSGRAGEGRAAGHQRGPGERIGWSHGHLDIYVARAQADASIGAAPIEIPPRVATVVLSELSLRLLQNVPRNSR